MYLKALYSGRNQKRKESGVKMTMVMMAKKTMPMPLSTPSASDTRQAMKLTSRVPT